jgi:hypothetical protein
LALKKQIREKTMIEILRAIAKMRDEVGEIPKNGYNPHYKYSYCTLEDLLSAINKPLQNNGLLLHCGLNPDNGENILSVVVLHWESGEKVENSLVLPRGEKSLEWGADLVFYRRHLIALTLGLSLPTGERGKATSKPKPQQTPQLITPQQMEYIGERIAGLEPSQVEAVKTRFGIKSRREITQSQFPQVADYIDSLNIELKTNTNTVTA